MPKFKDLTGLRFGKLVVLSYDHKNERGVSYWLCQCDCTNKKIIRGSNLTTGRTKSCNCHRDEMAATTRRRLKTFNEYELYENFGVGHICNSELSFIFDIEDYIKIKKYRWSLDKDNYVITRDKNLEENKNSMKIHRLIMNVLNNDDVIIDHKDHNPLNNRKINLRFANKSKNGMNSKISKNNTSGVIGVHWDKKNCVWIAQIMINRQGIYLGSYNNIENAIKARLLAEKEHFEEFAPQKSLFKKYGIE